MEQMRLGQLTKELVAEELRRMGDPCAAAAALVQKTISASLQAPVDGTPAARVIEDAVQGAMVALLLAEQSLPRAAVLMLQAVSEAAAAGPLDPTDAMRAALRGLADLRRFTDPDRVDDMRLEIDKHYMGAGEAFAECLREKAVAGR